MKSVLVLLFLLSLPALASAECGGSCQYFEQGENLLVSWSLDLLCGGKPFSHPTANAISGAFTYPCGSSLVSCLFSNNGQMQWTSIQPRPVLSGASVQGFYRNIDGSLFPGNSIACGLNGGGGGGGGGGDGPPPEPVCASVTIERSSETRNFPSGQFYGYNWTQAWLDQCASEGRDCHAPRDFFFAQCRDSAGQNMACPSVAWTVSAGQALADPLNPTSLQWVSPGTAGPVTVSATVPNCGSDNYAFFAHVLNACTITPAQASVSLSSSQAYHSACLDETGARVPCYYSVFLFSEPNLNAHFEPGEFNSSVSDVTFFSADTSGFARITAGGQTFSCNAAVTIGNPAVSCSLTPATAQTEVGQTVPFSLSCAASDGTPAICPFMQMQVQPPQTGYVDESSRFFALSPGEAQVQAASQSFDDFSPAPPFSCSATVNVQDTGPTLCTILPRASTFSGQTPDFAAWLSTRGDLESVHPLVLERPGMRLAFEVPVFACNQDFDAGIRSGPGFVALGHGFHLSVFNSPVRVTLAGFPSEPVPQLFAWDGVAQNRDQVLQNGQSCPAERCQNVQFDSQSGTLTFTASRFSSYAADSQSVEPSPVAPGNSDFFRLDCPLPQLGKNATVASAFLVENGAPTANESMELRVIQNNSLETYYLPIHVDAQSGQHEFALDIPLSTKYVLQAQSGDQLSNPCAFSAFQEETTLLPDLPLPLAVLAFLLAGLFATRKKPLA